MVILFGENGFHFVNTSIQSKDVLQCGKDWSNENHEWKITRVIDIYNSFIKNEELNRMIKFLLSSNILTLNIVKHSKEEIELNNQILDRLKRFMSLVHFISKYHKDKDNFLGKWKHIFNIITITTPTNHICVDLYPRIEEAKDISVQENQSFGSIVFIDSNSKFSFKENENFIGFGIMSKKTSNLNDSRSRIPINIFGSSLVQVVYPKNDSVDERGMFVILNKNQKENSGIGEIISFGDLITREADSYHLVGICSLDKTEQANSSLFLFSTPSRTSRITHPSNDFKICFVSMISLPMSDSLVHLLLQNTPWDFSKKKIFPSFLLL